MRRGAYFEVMDDESGEETLRDADWIVLDVRPELLAQLIEKVQVCQDIEKTDTVEKPKDRFWTVHMYVKPRHPNLGPTQKSLLSDEIE